MIVQGEVEAFETVTQFGSASTKKQTHRLTDVVRVTPCPDVVTG